MKLVEKAGLFFLLYVFLFVVSTFDATLYSYVSGFMEEEVLFSEFLLYNLFILPVAAVLYIFTLFVYNAVRRHPGKEKEIYKYLIEKHGFRKKHDFISGKYKRKKVSVISGDFLNIIFPLRKKRKIMRVGTKKFRGASSFEIKKDVFADGPKRKTKNYFKKMKKEFLFLKGLGDFEVYYFDKSFQILIDQKLTPEKTEKALKSGVKLLNEFKKRW